MVVRVYIDNDFIGDGIRVLVGRTTGADRLMYVRGGEDTEFIESGLVSSTVEVPQFARIPDDVGMALRDALIVHYGGAPETQWLRKDYDAERGRVDKLMGAIVDRLRSPL